MKVRGEKLDFITTGPGKRCFSGWKDASELEDVEFRIGEKVLTDAEIKTEGLEEVAFSVRVNLTPTKSNCCQVATFILVSDRN